MSIAGLLLESEMHEFWSKPGEGACYESHTGEASCRQHKRLVLAHIFHVLNIRCGFHMVRAFTLTPFRLLNEEKQKYCH